MNAERRKKSRAHEMSHFQEEDEEEVIMDEIRTKGKGGEDRVIDNRGHCVPWLYTNLSKERCSDL